MHQDAPAFAPYRSDPLFLLIGANPIPNYVAACLLASQGASVYLLRSQQTSRVAERLAVALARERPDLLFRYLDVPEADGPGIARAVEACAPQIAGASLNVIPGLNFSGGTKPMSVYSVLALRKTFERTVLSYLHAGTLSMVIDAGGPPQFVPVQRNVQLTLTNIAELHGFRITARRDEPRNLSISRAIGEVHLRPDGMRRWREWIDSWRTDGAHLPSAEDDALQSAVEAFRAASHGEPTPDDVAAALGFRDLSSCAKYFAGEWLEDLALHGVKSAATCIALDDCASGIDVQGANRDKFELDVAATIGHQLFGVSCVATELKPRAKEHLLEVVTRAGQMGGDEARFALICLSEKPEDLEKEVAQAWDTAGRLRVFGRQHLAHLDVHLLEWFRTANQEVT